MTISKVISAAIHCKLIETYFEATSSLNMENLRRSTGIYVVLKLTESRKLGTTPPSNQINRANFKMRREIDEIDHMDILFPNKCI